MDPTHSPRRVTSSVSTENPSDAAHDDLRERNGESHRRHERGPGGGVVDADGCRSRGSDARCGSCTARYRIAGYIPRLGAGVADIGHHDLSVSNGAGTPQSDRKAGDPTKDQEEGESQQEKADRAAVLAIDVAGHGESRCIDSATGRVSCGFTLQRGLHVSTDLSLPALGSCTEPTLRPFTRQVLTPCRIDLTAGSQLRHRPHRWSLGAQSAQDIATAERSNSVGEGDEIASGGSHDDHVIDDCHRCSDL